MNVLLVIKHKSKESKQPFNADTLTVAKGLTDQKLYKMMQFFLPSDKVQ